MSQASKIKRFSLSLDEATYNRLHNAASGHGLTLSKLVRAILNEYVESDGARLHLDKSKQILDDSPKSRDRKTAKMVQDLS